MTVFRIEVTPSANCSDPQGEAALHQALQVGFSPTAIETTSVYPVIQFLKK
jgi:phosphoribosylformylglycinamidine (FGAM) synthase PurS component